MTIVPLRGARTVDWDVVERVLAIIDRGGTFVVEAGQKIRVVPTGVLTAADRAFLVAHKPEVLRIVTYEADDAHLWR